MSTFFESRTSFSISIPLSLPIVSDMVTLLLLETTREQQFWIGPGSGAKYPVSGPSKIELGPAGHDVAGVVYQLSGPEHAGGAGTDHPERDPAYQRAIRIHHFRFQHCLHAGKSSVGIRPRPDRVTAGDDSVGISVDDCIYAPRICQRDVWVCCGAFCAWIWEGATFPGGLRTVSETLAP